jgi:hypothetical protein
MLFSASLEPFPLMLFSTSLGGQSDAAFGITGDAVFDITLMLFSTSGFCFLARAL